jgi:hypothetical protein
MGQVETRKLACGARREEVALHQARVERRAIGARCELCRRLTEHLVKTECWGRMVCAILLSNGPVVSKSSCLVKHSRFTLCGVHHNEEHGGDWKSCEVCPKTWPLEMYIWYGTNKWNFEKLENRPRTIRRIAAAAVG